MEFKSGAVEFFFGFGAADVDGKQGLGVHEVALLRELPAEGGDGACLGPPAGLIDDLDFGVSLRDEFLVVGNSFADQVQRARGFGEHFGYRRELGGVEFGPASIGSREGGGEDLISLGVKDDQYVFGFWWRVFGNDAD